MTARLPPDPTLTKENSQLQIILPRKMETIGINSVKKVKIVITFFKRLE